MAVRLGRKGESIVTFSAQEYKCTGRKTAPKEQQKRVVVF